MRFYMLSHKLWFCIITLCAILLICTCGRAGTKDAAYGGGVAMSRAMSVENTAYNESSGSSFDSDVSRDDSALIEEDITQSRKLIRRAELRLRVDNLEVTEEPLSRLMEKYGAWSASTGIYENFRNYNIRVPSDSYDAMLAELAGLGRMLGRTENAEDVTLRFYDLESRLATRQELLKTYQSYLGKAQNIDEIMTVERRIAELQMEIDHTGTQFRNLANQIDYSTIFLEISGPINAVSYSRPTLGERLRGLFGSFGDVLSSAFVVLIGIIVYGVPAVLIIILFFWLFFGRIGLIKKLWRYATGKSSGKT